MIHTKNTSVANQRRREASLCRRRKRARRHRLERLEDRRLLATITVTTDSDVVDAVDGVVSLREAVMTANNGFGDDTIQFAPGVSNIDLTQGHLEIFDNLTVEGSGVAIVASAGSRVFDVPLGNFDLSLTGLLLTGGDVTGDGENGGAIRSGSSGTLTITDSQISGGSAVNGGGVFSTGDVVITRSTISGNTATDDGGGINNGTPDVGFVSVTDSTISSNSAAQGGGLASDKFVIRNSTVSGNSATRFGGGVYSYEGGVTITNSTITGNTAGMQGGGVTVGIDLTISSTIVAGNRVTATGGLLTHDLFAHIVVEDSTFNLIGDNSGAPLFVDGEMGNQVGTAAEPIDAMLGPLADNGGPTRTHALIEGSPAVNAGDPGDTAGQDGVPLFDQRGVDRVLDISGGGMPRIDIGAFELSAPINQQPTFTSLSPVTTLERDDQETVTGFVTFDPGDESETGQSAIGYTVFNVSHPELFLIPPMIDTGGNLTFTPAPDAFGTTTFEVTVQDDGGTDNGGIDTSEPQTLTVTIENVNDAPTFSIGPTVTVSEDSGAQTIDGFASDFDPGPGEDGTSTDSRVLHDEGAGGVVDTLSNDNNNPTPVGPLTLGSNLVSGLIERALTVGNVDVFTFTIEPGLQLEGLFVVDYDYVDPPPPGEVAAFLAIDDTDSFPYNANELDINQNPFLDETLFIGGTVFGLNDAPTDNLLPQAGRITGSGFTGPLGPGTYTFYIQQTGPANTYTLDLRVTKSTNQVLAGYMISDVSDPSLFSEGPTIDGNGNLMFTPAPDAFGTATFQVTAQDDGGTANGGVDTSSPLIATITVTPLDDDDFGDAPSRYPVTLADDGARHTTGSLFLGSAVDQEPGGQPSDQADAEGDDDDGVLRIADLVAVTGATTTSSFTVIASEPGLLDAWIDFNGDGAWDDPGEQIATNFSLVAGSNILSFPVPGDAVAGITASRFRVSTAGGLLPTGDASDGEVEDYLTVLADGSTAPDVSVELPASNATLAADGSEIVVTATTDELFRVPVTAIDGLELLGTDQDDTITLDFTGGDIAGPPVLTLDGAAGSNTLRLSGGGGEFSFLANGGDAAAQRFDSIDLGDDENAHVIVIDAAAIAALSPTSLEVSVVGGEDDGILFDDAVDWRMGDTSIVDGRFIRSVVRSEEDGGSERIELDLPDPWQNVIDRSDVNNSGDVTANDALIIINELKRRQFGVNGTSVLMNPLDVAQWPGIYYDQTGDGEATALDALRVINQLARLRLGGESAELASDLVMAEMSSAEPAEADSIELDMPQPLSQNALQSNFGEQPDASAPNRMDSVAGENEVDASQRRSATDQLFAELDPFRAK